jgi:hypothetical protein
MFFLDSLMIAGIRWTLETVVSAAEADMNDDTALREQLLEALQRRELGEITEERYAEIEADLLARIREIKERREGGSGPLAFGSDAAADDDRHGRIQVEASVQGDFHQPASPAPSPVSASPRPDRTLVPPDEPPAASRAEPRAAAPRTRTRRRAASSQRKPTSRQRS